MNQTQFLFCLKELGITQVDAARLLSVTPRSITRWLDPENGKIPGPVEKALIAWIRMKRRGLSWRPDQIPFDEDWSGFYDQIMRLRQQTIIIDTILSQVEARGGPTTFWHVDLIAKEATFGPLKLSFVQLSNDSFSPYLYRRSDQIPDLERDKLLLDDACFCIAQEISKNGWPE